MSMPATGLLITLGGRRLRQKQANAQSDRKP